MTFLEKIGAGPKDSRARLTSLIARCGERNDCEDCHVQLTCLELWDACADHDKRAKIHSIANYGKGWAKT